MNNTLNGLNQALEIALNQIMNLEQSIKDDANHVQLLENQIASNSFSLNQKIQQVKELNLKLDRLIAGSPDINKLQQEILLLKEQLYQLNSQLTLSNSPEFK